MKQRRFTTRTLVLCSVALAAVLSTAACAPAAKAPAKDGGGAQAGVVEGETIASPALVKAACAEGSLTYYTVQTEADEQNIIAPFEEAFPCITVNIVASTSGPLFSRVQTEAAAGKVTGDVLLNSDAVAAAALKKANLIKAWTPPSSSKYPDDRKVDGVWYPGAGSLMYFIYNNQKVSKADAPKDWSDLTDPKWQGQISTSPATIGGTGWSVFYFLNQTFGKSYLEQLDKQKVTFFPSYSSVVSSVARGETSIGIECDLCDYRARTQQGAPLTPVYPTSGSVYVPYPMMLIAHSPHPKAAELFANWYVSKQGQEQVVKTRGAYSARADIGPAEGKPALSKVKVVAIPTDKVLADHDKFLSTYASIFG